MLQITIEMLHISYNEVNIYSYFYSYKILIEIEMDFVTKNIFFVTSYLGFQKTI